MRQLDAAETAAALPYPALVAALREMLARKRDGRARAPERMVVPLTAGTLLVMPSCDDEYAATKLVTVHTGNPARGLPTLLGEVILMRADSGERLLTLDGPTVTARRTAAVSALAAQALAPRPPRELLIVGSGVQALSHLEAFAASFALARVHVASRSHANAARFAARAREAGHDCVAIEDAASVLDRVDAVVTATTSETAVLADAARFDGFVAAVGAFRPTMCEVPAALVQRARLVVDDLAGARHEAGDLIQAGVDWQRVAALEDVLAAGEAPRPGPVVFKSVGQALWDLAACRVALQSAG